MANIGYKNNNQFYSRVIKKYGVSARGVHWSCEESQYIRFKELTKFIQNELEHSIIVDAGCGFGEYYNYLFDNNLKPKQYIGIDCEEQMITLASKRFVDTKFILKNILEDKLPSADYYICSGAMNTLTQEEVFNFIKKSYKASKKGFIFNFLKEDSLTNIPIKSVITFCKTICSQIEVKDDYLENDISIYLKK
ncbi:MAG: class I SAM-dependent methyltransferase [Poseidonibacter sp.]